MEAIIVLKERIYKERNKSHMTLPIRIGKGSKLQLTLYYEPKVVIDDEDIRLALKDGIGGVTDDPKLAYDEVKRLNYPINNLVTISLFKDGNFIGCKHRHDNPMEITIERNNCTPGFIYPQSFTGNYEIVLSFHGIFSPFIDLEFKGEVE